MSSLPPSAPKSETICVVGLGYVGLPLACLLSTKFTVLGYDANAAKVQRLAAGDDPTGEVSDLAHYRIQFSADPAVISQATFIIIAVPTPVTVNNVPDFRHLEQASATVGKHLQSGSVVVYESTVHPGCTEDICLPILERESGLNVDQDFQLGYSPERVNPGDREHAIDRITKIVAGRTPEALERIAKVYDTITTVYRAPSIKVAEAAKVVENIQRDVNIALVNELALVFDRLNLDTLDVLSAAGTKWNFHPYRPGLVGGHCIAVDPYYLVHEALKNGLEPKLILGARALNSYLPKFIVRKLVTLLHAGGRGIGGAHILVLGLTFKENVRDTRNSRAFELVEGLRNLKARVSVHDPLLSREEIEAAIPAVTVLDDPTQSTEPFDAVVVVTPHRQYRDLTVPMLRQACRPGAVFFDLKGFYDRAAVNTFGLRYHRL